MQRHALLSSALLALLVSLTPALGFAQDAAEAESNAGRVVVPLASSPWNQVSIARDMAVGAARETTEGLYESSSPPANLYERLPLARQLVALGLDPRKIAFEAERLSDEEFDLWAVRVIESFLPESPSTR